MCERHRERGKKGRAREEVLIVSLTFYLFYLFLERGERREKERERNIGVGKKHQEVASCKHPNLGPGVQPRHVP